MNLFTNDVINSLQIPTFKDLNELQEHCVSSIKARILSADPRHPYGTKSVTLELTHFGSSEEKNKHQLLVYFTISNSSDKLFKLTSEKFCAKVPEVSLETSNATKISVSDMEGALISYKSKLFHITDVFDEIKFTYTVAEEIV